MKKEGISISNEDFNEIFTIFHNPKNDMTVSEAVTEIKKINLPIPLEKLISIFSAT